MVGPAGRLDAISARYAAEKVVVLGAAGFIGRWVARTLAASRAELVLVVRDRARAASLFDELEIPGQVVVCDLRTADDITCLIRREQPAIVFNLAGYGVDPGERADALAFSLNARLVGTLCEALASTDVPGWTGQRIVHAGSALEYGAVGGALAETTEPRPTTLYGQSKLAGTRLLQQCCRATELRGVSARLFTVYGSGEIATRLLPTLAAAAQREEPVELSSGVQRRDFTYVDDVVEGLLRLGVGPVEPGAVVNLATGRLTAVRTFAETAADILGMARARLHFGALPTRPEEMVHDAVDVGLLWATTRWRPTTTPAEGIARTVALSWPTRRSTAGARAGR